MVKPIHTTETSSNTMSNIALQFLDGPNLMVQRAIASGYRHGIELIPGRANAALGNCAFEAPIFNNNDRSCFANSSKRQTENIDYKGVEPLWYPN